MLRLDPAHDTPFELLHTYSLGIMKYGWRQAMSKIPKDRVDILVVMLDSARIALILINVMLRIFGCTAMVLNGRHYRFLSECLPLQLFGILTKAEDKVTCQLMLAIAALGAHLCFPIIKNVDKYTVRHKAERRFQWYSIHHAMRN